MDLREPKKKRVGPHIKPQQRFPILIESECGIPVDSDFWPLYIGNFMGDSVVVCNPEEMQALYTMGYFGKGSLSRSYPSFGLTKKGVPPIIKESQWQRRKSWIERMKRGLVDSQKSQIFNDITKCDSENNVKKNKDEEESDVVSMDVDVPALQPCTDKAGEVDSLAIDVPALQPCSDKAGQSESTDNNGCNFTENSVNTDHLKHCESNDNLEITPDLGSEFLVLADSDDEDIEKLIRDPQPHLENEEFKTAVENLCLTLEESFFLSYALGCLQVLDISGNPMSLKTLWCTFCKVKEDFIESYVAYHYFRAKGWVVKSGYKFGGDFLLYKQGPPFYHASCVVLVERVDCWLKRHGDSPTWTKFHGINRLAESSGKDIITCQVVFPDNLTAEDLSTPKSLSKFQVNEVLIKRWISSQEREDKDQH